MIELKIELEKLYKEIDNIEQLGADMRYKVNNDNLDLEQEIESIKNWLKSIERRTKKIRGEIMEITRELYDFLEKTETIEIKNMIYASIVYLKKARKQDIKKIIKEIKELNRAFDR